MCIFTTNFQVISANTFVAFTSYDCSETKISSCRPKYQVLCFLFRLPLTHSVIKPEKKKWKIHFGVFRAKSHVEKKHTQRGKRKTTRREKTARFVEIWLNLVLRRHSMSYQIKSKQTYTLSHAKIIKHKSIVIVLPTFDIIWLNASQTCH